MLQIKRIKITSDKNISELFQSCQYIVNENLVENNGTLRQSNLIDGDYIWSDLIIVLNDNYPVAFALIRYSDCDKHSTGCDEYYYISQIAVSKAWQGKKIGSALLGYILENITDLPIIASVRKDNPASIKLFNKYMKNYSERRDYLRYMDEATYDKTLNGKGLK